MRYGIAVVAGVLAGAVCAPVGALTTLIIIATTDISLSSLGLILSSGAILGSLPVVILVGAIVGALLGLLTAWVFSRL